MATPNEIAAIKRRNVFSENSNAPVPKHVQGQFLRQLANRIKLLEGGEVAITSPSPSQPNLDKNTQIERRVTALEDFKNSIVIEEITEEDATENGGVSDRLKALEDGLKLALDTIEAQGQLIEALEEDLSVTKTRQTNQDKNIVDLGGKPTRHTSRKGVGKKSEKV